MGLPNQAHVRIGGTYYKLDEAAPIEVGRPPYRHWSRSLFVSSLVATIEGNAGARNINPDQLVWELSQYDGEGQLVLEDRSESHQFYRSEGLDFRTAGQFSLNRSSLLQSPLDSSGGTTGTIQGSSFTDVTGTSTTVNTDDQRLSVINDEIESTVHTPGAGTVQVDFYLYQEGIQYTTVEGDSMVLLQGSGSVSGTDFVLVDEGSGCRTPNLSGLSTKPVEVNWYAYAGTTSERAPTATFKIVNTTDANNPKVVYQSDPIKITSTSTALVNTATFTPVAGKTYRVYTRYENRPQDTAVRLKVDKVTYGVATDPSDSARIAVYNSTSGAEVTGANKTVYFTNTASTKDATLVFTAVAATNYKYRVRYAAGSQRPVTDKVITTVQSTSTWTIDALELGQGGSIWLAGHRSATSSQTWTYNFSTENWTARQALSNAANNTTILALAHTDAYEYALGDDNKVQQFTTAAKAAYTAAITGTQVGMCIAQNRLITLSEDSTNGVVIHTYAVDDTALPTAQLSSTIVTSAKNTADTTMRQRMVATPTGGRFFVNFSDVTTKIYEADTSGATPVVTEIGELDQGTKASSICYAAGITFVTGQFAAETGQTGRSALFTIDQNNIVTRVGWFRRDAPDARAPAFMVPYQNDLWILQGNYVWRYSLITGGLFLEYELQPKTPGNNMALAVMQGHTWAAYSDEGIFVTGTVSTYRQAGAATSNQYTSSVFDFGLPAVRKVFDRIDIITDQMPAATDVKLEYQADQSGTWTPLGSFTTGADHRVHVSSEDSSAIFTNMQIRVTLGSQTGANTPVVKNIVLRAFPTEYEEFFDLILRCNDEDSADHIDNQEVSGADQARNLRALWQTGAYTTLTDGYESEQDDDAPTYTVRIENFSEEFAKQGEGRMSCSLRVIAG